MKREYRIVMATVLALVFARAAKGDDLPHADYLAHAAQVMQYIQARYYLADKHLYAHSLSDRHPDLMWGDGVMFTALVGAARNAPAPYTPLMNQFFQSLDRYWDAQDHPPGYEPSPTRGGGHDKYYDDNAWMVLAFTEAYELTHDSQYLGRSERTLEFVLSGWDDECGGGIWWHEGHKNHSKNTCVNAPAAVACLRVAHYLPPDQAEARVATAKKIVDWTVKTLQEDDGLFADAINVDTGKLNRARLTYNTGLMIRAFLGLHRATGQQAYLDQAKRCAVAADWFLDSRTGAYRDDVKWAHLMVEADLEMYRATGDQSFLLRASRNADYQFESWKQHRPETLIDNASIARMLWLMADTQSESGRKFWAQMDKPTHR